MSKPLVSILLPCYNVEAYLPQCLDSICRQTYTNLQVVLIDDGSKDGTWNVMQQYAEQDPRMEIYQQENQGVATTRNHLLSKIKGEYTLFVDSDDWIEPDMVEFLLCNALMNKSDVVVCEMVMNDTPICEGYEYTRLSKEESISAFLFHKELKGSLWNKLVMTSLLHKLTFDATISYGEDALFCFHFFQKAENVLLTTKQLYHYRMNENSISHQSFDFKKLTGHKTWKIINDEAALWWPQYLHIAQARWGMEDMYLLRQASQSSYKKDNNIKQLQKTIRKFLPQMKKTGLLEGREILNANIMCRWYGYNRIYCVLNKFKNRQR